MVDKECLKLDSPYYAGRIIATSHAFPDYAGRCRLLVLQYPFRIKLTAPAPNHSSRSMSPKILTWAAIFALPFVAVSALPIGTAHDVLQVKRDRAGAVFFFSPK